MEHVSWLAVGKMLVSLTSRRRGMMYGLAGSLWCKQNKKLRKQYLTQCLSLQTSPIPGSPCAGLSTLLLASTQQVQ
jgi:hypothetical protein